MHCGAQFPCVHWEWFWGVRKGVELLFYSTDLPLTELGLYSCQVTPRMREDSSPAAQLKFSSCVPGKEFPLGCTKLHQNHWPQHWRLKAKFTFPFHMTGLSGSIIICSLNEAAQVWRADCWRQATLHGTKKQNHPENLTML